MGRHRWLFWFGVVGLLGASHGAVIALANHVDATQSALYGDPLGVGLALAAIGLRFMWWVGGPAFFAVGCVDMVLGPLASEGPREAD